MVKEPNIWEKTYRSAPYEDLPWEVGRPEPALMRLVESERIKPGKVLDVGCGAGTHAIYLAQKGFDVTAVDISEFAIKIAKRRAEKAGVKINFLVADATKLKFKKEEFDFIFDRACFHHIPIDSRKKYAQDLAKFMKPKGKLFLMVFSEKNHWEGKENVFSLSKIQFYFIHLFKIIEFRETLHQQPNGENVILWAVLMERG